VSGLLSAPTQLQQGPPYGPLIQNLEVWWQKPTPPGPLNKLLFCIPLQISHLNLHSWRPSILPTKLWVPPPFFFPLSPPYSPSSGRPPSQPRRRGGAPPSTASEPARRCRSPGPRGGHGRACARTAPRGRYPPRRTWLQTSPRCPGSSFPRRPWKACAELLPPAMGVPWIA
jgi:hypothetical protein